MSAGKSLSSKEEHGKSATPSGLPCFFVASEEATAKPRQGQSTLTLLLNKKNSITSENATVIIPVGLIS